MAYDGKVLRQATLRFDEDKQRRQEQQRHQNGPYLLLHVDSPFVSFLPRQTDRVQMGD